MYYLKLRCYKEQAVTDFSSAVVAPVRARLTEQMAAVAKDSVNLEGLQTMLPMVLMALVQSVDVPQLLAALNLDPDTIETIVTRTSEYFKGHMK